MNRLEGAPFVVANPGVAPELQYMAAGLAAGGLLESYMTPLSFGSDSGVPAWLPTSWSRQYERRRLPVGLSQSYVRPVARVPEMGFKLADVAGLSRERTAKLLRWRNGQFDTGVARRMRGTTASPIVLATAGAQTLRAARRRDVVSFLNYPIAHHDYSRHLMAEEADMQPAFADTLQWHALPAWQYEQLDEEIELASFVLCLSSFQQKSFIASGVPRHKLAVVPLGVDVSLFQPPSRPGHKKPFVILFAGQITQRKGVSYLLEAFRNLSVPDAELWLVGRCIGSARVLLEGEPGVRLIDHVPRRDLPPLYARASAFVLPSLVEGFGQTPLEAMASGVPTIVSEHTFADDIIEDGTDGIIVPVRDVSAIVKALEWLAADPDRAHELGLRGADTARKWTWPRYQCRMTTMLSRLRNG